MFKLMLYILFHAIIFKLWLFSFLKFLLFWLPYNNGTIPPCSQSGIRNEPTNFEWNVTCAEVTHSSALAQSVVQIRRTVGLVCFYSINVTHSLSGENNVTAPLLSYAKSEKTWIHGNNSPWSTKGSSSAGWNVNSNGMRKMAQSTIMPVVKRSIGRRDVAWKQKKVREIGAECFPGA